MSQRLQQLEQTNLNMETINNSFLELRRHGLLKATGDGFNYQPV